MGKVNHHVYKVFCKLTKQKVPFSSIQTKHRLVNISILHQLSFTQTGLSFCGPCCRSVHRKRWRDAQMEQQETFCSFHSQHTHCKAFSHLQIFNTQFGCVCPLSLSLSPTSSSLTHTPIQSHTHSYTPFL